MSGFGWESAPHDTREQVERLVALLRAELGENLVGIYLHGSLAMGCFNPAVSDVDMLVVNERRMRLETKHDLMHVLLAASGRPRPLELSFLSRTELTSWRHPTPYDFHFGEDHRAQYEEDLASGGWERWDDGERLDEDLAGHLTVTRERGVVLWGAPIADVFPDVPAGDYLASILADLEWARARPDIVTEYRLLNLCRVLGYLETGRVMSKREGGEWALEATPEGPLGPVRTALAVYAGDEKGEYDHAALERAFAWLEERVAELAGRRR